MRLCVSTCKFWGDATYLVTATSALYKALFKEIVFLPHSASAHSMKRISFWASSIYLWHVLLSSSLSPSLGGRILHLVGQCLLFLFMSTGGWGCYGYTHGHSPPLSAQHVCSLSAWGATFWASILYTLLLQLLGKVTHGLFYRSSHTSCCL